MPINYAGSRQPRGIPSALIESRAKADGDLIGDMAGNALWLEQYVSGDAPAGGSAIAPPTPLNGERFLGHDHSGGVMGLPQKHTIWSHCWGHYDTGVDNNRAPIYDGLWDDPLLLIDAPIGPVWCPPGYIYNRGVRGHVTLYSESGATDVDIEFKGEAGSKAEKLSQTLTSNTIMHISTDGLFFLKPGDFCFPTLRIKILSTTVAVVHLLAASIDQVYDEAIPAIGTVP